MVKHPNRPAPQAVSSGHFLYCKSDHLQPCRFNLKRPEPESQPRLSDSFPRLPAGKSFAETFLSCVESVPVFSVLGMRILKGPVSGIPRNPRFPGAAGILLEKLEARISTNPDGGLVGIIDTDTIGWGIPGLGPAQAVEAASLFIAGLPDSVASRLVVGIASFPCLDYEKIDTLQNARKATDHATILGASGIVVFDALTLNVSGDQLFELGDISGAMAEYGRGLELDPENENLHNSLGVCHGIRGEIDAAMACFEKTLAVNPAEIMAIYNTGYLYQLKGEPDMAIAAFLKAGNLDPGLFEAAFQAGQTYLAMGQAENAELFLERAVSLKPQSNPAQRLLGECRAAIGKYTGAETALREAIRISPQDAESLSTLGRLYERENRNLDIAAVFHRQTIALAPENGRYHLRLARVLLKLASLDEALDACRNALSLGSAAEDLQAEIMEKMALRDNAPDTGRESHPLFKN